MKNWLKQNWFKLGVLLIFIILGLSVSYYHILFLPKLQIQKGKTEIKEKVTKDNFNLQERCAKAAKDDFHDLWPNPDGRASFSCHYNSKLNKCFVEIFSANFLEDGAMVNYISLQDVYENTVYGIYSDRTEKLGSRPTIVSCEMLGQHCKNIEEFNNLKNKYMVDD